MVGVPATALFFAIIGINGIVYGFCTYAEHFFFCTYAINCPNTPKKYMKLSILETLDIGRWIKWFPHMIGANDTNTHTNAESTPLCTYQQNYYWGTPKLFQLNESDNYQYRKQPQSILCIVHSGKGLWIEKALNRSVLYGIIQNGLKMKTNQLLFIESAHKKNTNVNGISFAQVQTKQINWFGESDSYRWLHKSQHKRENQSINNHLDVSRRTVNRIPLH